MKANGASVQEKFWRGEFGKDYLVRNDETLLPAYRLLWARILLCLGQVPRSFLEVGANTGLNLKALNELCEGRSKFYAVEPNRTARELLDGSGLCEQVIDGTASKIGFADGIADLAFTSGVLIHVPPHELPDACRQIHRCASRWIACIEYFNDTPEMIPYRGHDDVLFKRDYGAYWMDQFPDLKCISYGFIWKRETGLDNLNWWLFEKGAN